MPSNIDVTEVSLAYARNNMAEVTHAAAVHGRITYLTNRGRRVAAIVSVPQADTLTATRNIE